MVGARGRGSGAVMIHSVAGCAGAPQRLQGREGLAAVELRVQGSPVCALVELVVACGLGGLEY